MKVSSTALTSHEAGCTRHRIESVPFAEAVIAGDSGGTPGSVEIRREPDLQVMVTEDYPGNGLQKNRGLGVMSIMQEHAEGLLFARGPGALVAGASAATKWPA